MKLTSYFLIGFLLALAGCTPQKQGQPKEWLAQHVIFIGLDGWGAYSVEKADMPHVKQLMGQGAYTLKKRSVLPASSAVNWASMFMGAGPEIHGFTTWNSKTPELPSRVISHYGMFPTVFGLLRDAHPEAEIGYEYEWDGMQYLAELSAMNFAMEVKNYKTNQDTAFIVACNYIRQAKPNLFALIVDEPDHVGHEAGHDTPEYYTVLHMLDGYIGQIIDAVKEAGFYDETIFIISADHGGLGNGHEGMRMQEMETPFIIAGKNVKSGWNFDDLSMMQFDVASTIAYIFRLEQPQVWIGRPVKGVFVE
jgi:predicted AlkP superfamily pyrophosphatase or phosphodiesterase